MPTPKKRKDEWSWKWCWKRCWKWRFHRHEKKPKAVIKKRVRMSELGRTREIKKPMKEEIKKVFILKPRKVKSKPNKR
jgi:hypothetical protein